MSALTDVAKWLKSSRMAAALQQQKKTRRITYSVSPCYSDFTQGLSAVDLGQRDQPRYL